MPGGIVDGEDQMPVGAVNQFKGHSSRPVIGIFGATGRAELGVASKRDKLKCSAMGAAVKGTPHKRDPRNG